MIGRAPRSPLAWLRRRHASRGQALIEFAGFFMFMLFLTSGVANVGGLLNDHLSIVYATRQGARTGAVLGQQTNADCAIIGAITAAMASLPNVEVTGITIYKAGASGQSLGQSDVYTETAPGVPISCTGTPPVIVHSALDAAGSFLPSSRNNLPFSEDSLGVQVTYKYTYQFPFLGGGTFTASDYTVMPINPVGLPTTPTPGGTCPSCPSVI